MGGRHGRSPDDIVRAGLYNVPIYRLVRGLIRKNSENLFALMQNISFLGMVRKISGSVSYSDIYLIIGGLLLFGLPYLRISQYKYEAFRKTLLASVLMFVVLFSTGSESSTYIIAFIGVAIWYTAVPWKRSTLDIVLMVFAFILTSMSPSDLSRNTYECIMYTRMR